MGAQIIDLYAALKASLEEPKAVARAVGPFACPCGCEPCIQPASTRNAWRCLCPSCSNEWTTFGFGYTPIAAWLDWLVQAETHAGVMS